MGVNVGQPRLIRDPKTRRVEYIGPVVNAAARITALANGGQVDSCSNPLGMDVPTIRPANKLISNRSSSLKTP